MKSRLLALVVAVALLGGLFGGVAAAGSPAPAPAQTADEFNLRTTAPCLLNGQATTCTIDVNKLKRSRSDVIAHGTVTAANGPSVRFTAPVEGSVPGTATAGQQIQAACDILNLVLGPLHLDLLGLVIDLNQVVLDITGETGAGNLLGNLLCGLFGILDAPGGITEFLRVLDGLLSTINDLLRL
jgi:hypothetical protein